VENREGGTKTGSGSARLEAAEAGPQGQAIAAGVDSSAANDGGAIFGNPRRGIRLWPRATVGGRDGSVGKGDVEVQEGTGLSIERVKTHPVGGPWAGVRGHPMEPGTGSGKVRRAATSIGLVSWKSRKDPQERRGSEEMATGGDACFARRSQLAGDGHRPRWRPWSTDESHIRYGRPRKRTRT